MIRNLKVAVCEDDDTQREYICSLVSQWAEAKGIFCQTDGYVSSEQLIFSFNHDFPYRIYFLDIQMGKINGLELAARIRERDSHAEIIFLTGLKEYALDGYKVGAFRYVLKPVKEGEIFSLLDELAEKKIPVKENYFILEQHGELIKIPYSDIWYITSQGHYVEMAYGTKKVRWKAGLGMLQREFEENGFVLSRRGVLVNLEKVSRVGKEECILDNGEVIPISRNRYKKVNEAFIQYYQRGEI